jgi:hypothetical protein
MNQTNITICPSCGAAVADNYCSVCGEKKRTAADLSLKHFVEESVEGISHFDGRFFRTIKILFTKPGLLTLDFERGRRVPYMKPFQLFIVANLLFFLLGHGTSVFTTTLESFYHSSDYTQYGSKEIIDRKAPNEKQRKALGVAFNEKMHGQSKVFIILFIPVIAIGCALLYINKRKYFSLHLTFATHFFSFVLLYFLLFFFVVELPAYYIFGLRNDYVYDQVFGISSIVVLIIYLAIAGKRFYKAHLGWCITAALGLGVLFIVTLKVYRLLLFFKIIHSM